jgi:hypothetical protein
MEAVKHLEGLFMVVQCFEGIIRFYREMCLQSGWAPLSVLRIGAGIGNRRVE